MPGWLDLALFVGGRLPTDTPRGAWVAVLYLSLLAVLAFGCALPHRAPTELLTSRRRLVLVGVVCGLAGAQACGGSWPRPRAPTSPPR